MFPLFYFGLFNIETRYKGLPTSFEFLLDGDTAPGLGPPLSQTVEFAVTTGIGSRPTSDSGVETSGTGLSAFVPHIIRVVRTSKFLHFAFLIRGKKLPLADDSGSGLRAVALTPVVFVLHRPGPVAGDGMARSDFGADTPDDVLVFLFGGLVHDLFPYGVDFSQPMRYKGL